MSTRQLRISNSTQIRQRIGEFAGKKINIVLRDNTAMTGVLSQITANEITLKNMRGRNVLYSFNDIMEIFFDTAA